MSKDFNCMGLNFDNLTMDEVILKIEDNINSKKPLTVFTPNAELIVLANKDKELKKIYNNSGILTIDSWVVYYSAKFLRKKIKEPVSAARLMFKLLEVANEKEYKLYCLGAKDEVVKEAVKNIKKKYARINIVGYHHGYFNFEKDEDIIRNINDRKPDILFVAMSSPLKEYFIAKSKDRLNVPVSIGVGGTVDILAGSNRLAPRWVSRIGMEWFYRFIQEPKRLWKRYLLTNTIFIYLFLREVFRQIKKGVLNDE